MSRMHAFAYWFGEALKFFFLLTPFVVLSAFMSFTRRADDITRRRAILRFLAAAILICGVLFAGGNVLFRIMAISVDSFRVGAGLILMITALGLARGTMPEPQVRDEDFAVVPLALPIAIGPGTIGTLLVMRASAENKAEVALSLLALVTALVAVGALLMTSDRIEKRLGRLGLSILSRVTGLILAAFSAQLVLTGIKNVLFPA